MPAKRRTARTTAAAAKKTAVKATVEPTPVKEETKATETVKETTPVVEAVMAETEVTKKTTKATTRKVANQHVYIQFAGKEIDVKDIEKNVKAAWMAETGKKASECKEYQIYVKPEENAVYYVVNGDVDGGGRIDL